MKPDESEPLPEVSSGRVSPPYVPPPRPLEGLDVYYPYAPPSVVRLLNVMAVVTTVVGIGLLFFRDSFATLLAALGTAGTLLLWAVAIDYLARTAHNTRVAAALAWAQQRRQDPP